MTEDASTTDASSAASSAAEASGSAAIAKAVAATGAAPNSLPANSQISAKVVPSSCRKSGKPEFARSGSAGRRSGRCKPMRRLDAQQAGASIAAVASAPASRLVAIVAANDAAACDPAVRRRHRRSLRLPTAAACLLRRLF